MYGGPKKIFIIYLILRQHCHRTYRDICFEMRAKKEYIAKIIEELCDDSNVFGRIQSHSHVTKVVNEEGAYVLCRFSSDS